MATLEEKYTIATNAVMGVLDLFVEAKTTGPLVLFQAQAFAYVPEVAGICAKAAVDALEKAAAGSKSDG